MEQQDLTEFADVAKNAMKLIDYDVQIVGQGPPRVPPLPVVFDKCYHLAITCSVRSQLVSTSDVYAGITPQGVVKFDEDCGVDDHIGFFVNPHTFQLIQVPHAGCSRFWIKFELGKFLFPEILNDNLAILNPQVARLASDHFRIPFVQGCQ